MPFPEIVLARFPPKLFSVALVNAELAAAPAIFSTTAVAEGGLTNPKDSLEIPPAAVLLLKLSILFEMRLSLAAL